MIHFPTEVLHLIFNQLSQRDQLECMTVCRQLQNVTNTYNVFRVIYICSDLKMNSLIKSVQKNPTLGENVERLVITLTLEQRFNGGIIIKLFPNLREFNLTIRDAKEILRVIITPQKRYSWCNYIEKIVEHSTPFYSKTLIHSGICTNLNHIVTTSLKSSEMSSYMKSLVNTPALKTLELKNCDLGYSDLELLHESVPLLNSLVLKRNRFQQIEINQVIKPAVSLKILKCTGMTFYLNEDRGYYYYSDEFDDDEYDDDDRHFNPLIDPYSSMLPYVGQKYTHVEELELDVNIKGSEYDFDDEIAYSRRTNFSYQENMMIFDYLRKLGTRLKILSLKKANNYDFLPCIINFGVLDDSLFRIKTLELGSRVDGYVLLKLKDATLVHTIESIAVNGLKISGTVSNSLYWLRYYTNLKELTLKFRYVKCDLTLNDLLYHLSEIQLKTLRLIKMNLIFDNTKPIPVYPSLKELTLSKVTFKKGADVFLSRAFSNLKSLELHMESTRKQTLMFPNTDLISLKVQYTQTEEEFPILVVTAKNNQQRLYSLNSSRPFDKSEDNPIITIMCHSLYDFVWRKSVHDRL